MIERLAAAAMGTRFELVLVAAEPGPRPGPGPWAGGRGLRAAGEAALEVIAECDARYSAFRRDSLVARIRREAARAPVRVDEPTYGLLAACLELWHATGGAFDVGLGGAMETLGFRGRAALSAGFEPPVGPPFALDARTRSVSTPRPGAWLDLGGVAKGFALDLAACELREAGVECALLHGGTSSVIAIGAPPGTRGWRVAVADPQVDGADLAVVLRDASLSISAPHGRTARDAAGRTGGHVLDPRSGHSVAPGRLACVVHASGLVADALATALAAGAAPALPPGTLLSGAASAVLGASTGRRWTFGGDPTHVFETRAHQTS